MDFGKHPVTTKFMRGIFKLRTPAAKYTTTWDVKPVLCMLRTWNNALIPLKKLSIKCVLLLALSTGQRAQTLAAMDLNNMQVLSDKLFFQFTTTLKTTRPGHIPVLEVIRFDTDTTVCPVQCILDYIKHVDKLRKGSQLFVSLQSPHSAVSSQTISRWISTGLRMADIPDIFKGHSTRGAAASKAYLTSDINSVLKTAGWSNERTFAAHYRRPIVSSTARSFCTSVLSN